MGAPSKSSNEQYDVQIRNTVSGKMQLYDFMVKYKLKGKFLVALLDPVYSGSGNAYINIAMENEEPVLKGAGTARPIDDGVEVKFTKLTPTTKKLLNSYYDLFSFIKSEGIKFKELKPLLNRYTLADFVNDSDTVFNSIRQSNHKPIDPFETIEKGNGGRSPASEKKIEQADSFGDENDDLSLDLPFEPKKAKEQSAGKPEKPKIAEEQNMGRVEKPKLKKPLIEVEGEDDEDEQDEPLDASRTMVMPTRKVNYYLKNLLTDEIYSIDDGINTIGRLPDCNVCIDDESVSKRHAKITKIHNDLFIADLNSSNGTIVNDKILGPGEKIKLQSMDKIVISDFEFVLEKKLPQKMKRKKPLVEKVPLRKKHLGKAIIAIATVLFLAIVVFAVYRGILSTQPPEVEIAIVSVGKIDERANFSGKVIGYKKFVFVCEISCIVSEFKKVANDYIERNEVVLELDKNDIQNKINEVFEEKKTLEANKDGIDKEEFAERVKTLGAKVDKLKKFRMNSIVKAPFSGTLSEKSVNVGDKVEAGGQVFTLTNFEEVLFESIIDEELMNMLDNDDVFTVLLSGLKEPVKARLESLDKQKEDPKFRLILALDNKSKEIKTDMTGSVKGQVDKGAVIIIPRKAVLPVKGDAFVYVYSQGKITTKKVVIKRWFKNEVVVSSGLEPKEEIVVSDLTRLKSGIEVILLDK